MKLATLGEWHRRLGLIILLAVVWLAISGIFLNHTGALRLAERSMPLQLQQWFYPADSALSGRVLDDSVWLQTHNGDLYQQSALLGHCGGELLSVDAHDDIAVLACQSDMLIVMISEVAVVERVSAAHGLPTPIDCIHYIDDAWQLLSADQRWRLDLERMQWTSLGGRANTPSCSASVGQLTLSALQRHALNPAELVSPVSWERFLLDLHTGRVLGSLGRLLLDAAAIVLLIVSFTGLWLWDKRRRLFD